MSETKALYDGDPLPAIKAKWLPWITAGTDKDFDLFARALPDLAWLIADCERQRAENGVLAATIRAGEIDDIWAAAARARLAALDAWFDSWCRYGEARAKLAGEPWDSSWLTEGNQAFLAAGEEYNRRQEALTGLLLAQRTPPAGGEETP